jgi:hypothetical protein
MSNRSFKFLLIIVWFFHSVLSDIYFLMCDVCDKAKGGFQWIKNVKKKWIMLLKKL